MYTICLFKRRGNGQTEEIFAITTDLKSLLWKVKRRIQPFIAILEESKVIFWILLC